MLNDALAFLFQECILDTTSEACTVGKNAHTYDRKFADSDPGSCYSAAEIGAYCEHSDSGVCQKSLLQR